MQPRQRQTVFTTLPVALSCWRQTFFGLGSGFDVAGAAISGEAATSVTFLFSTEPRAADPASRVAGLSTPLSFRPSAPSSGLTCFNPGTSASSSLQTILGTLPSELSCFLQIFFALADGGAAVSA